MSYDYEKIVDRIIEKIIDFQNLEKKLNNKNVVEHMNAAPDTSYIEEELEEHRKETIKEVSENIVKLQKISYFSNYYFFDCPIEVYKKNYSIRKFKYLSQNIDSDEADFLMAELQESIDLNEQRVLSNSEYSDISYHRFLDYKIFSSNSYFKKQDYLIDRLEKLGWYSYKIEDTDGIPHHYEFEQKEGFKNNDNNVKKIDFNSSEELNNYLVKSILNYQDFINIVGEDINYRLDKGLGDEIDLDFEKQMYEIELLKKQKALKELILKLYYKSNEDNFFFFDSPLSTYESNFESLYDNYKKKYLDASQTDFIKSEINHYEKANQNRFLYSNDKKVDYSSYIDFNDKIFKHSVNKKIEFLKNYSTNQNAMNSVQKKEILPKPAENPVSDIENNVINKENTETNKNSKQLTANQSVILLDQIGFFTHKYIECLSKNQQAIIIGKLIGKDKKNISNYISKLDLKTKTENYQRDRDKIENLLDI